MPKDLETESKRALDAMQEWNKSMERTSQKLKDAKFHNTSTSFMPDFEKFQAMKRAQNQAPMDMVAELKAINERLDKQQNESSKETQASKRREWLTIIIGILTLAATVLIGILK